MASETKIGERDIDFLTAVHLMIDEAMCRLGYTDPEKSPPDGLCTDLANVSTLLFRRCVSTAPRGYLQRIKRIRAELEARYGVTPEPAP